jgi:ketosteroid isomerase-like protein
MEDDRGRRAADELEIRNVVARLALLADDGDLNEYISLFTEDAHWEAGGFPPRRGHAEILEGARQRRAAGTQGPGTNTHHVVTNLTVRVEGDTATASAYYLMMANTNATPTPRATGSYRDEFRRTPDGWKLSRRVGRAG